MNDNSTLLKIHKLDFLRLPPNQRCLDDGPMVLSMVDGRSTFVRAEIIE